LREVGGLPLVANEVNLDHHIGRKAEGDGCPTEVPVQSLQFHWPAVGQRVQQEDCPSILALEHEPSAILALAVSGNDNDAIAVGKIVNDERLLTVPTLSVCGLKFSEMAQAVSSRPVGLPHLRPVRAAAPRRR
jgi:hypothetical protein